MKIKKRATLTHLNKNSELHMVDVSQKPVTKRLARACGFLRLSRDTLELLFDQKLPKGDALNAARIAGILAAKRTSEWIPLAHPVALDFCDLQFEKLQSTKTGVRMVSTVTTCSKTGVETEALTAVCAAALTLYDMVKSVEKGAVIEEVVLLEKSGGRSGHYQRDLI